jgi:phosphoglycerate kinase
LGGAKVNDKLDLISKMIDVADEIIIGGGMVYPFVQ